jgi:hypothetical protein
MIMVNPAGAREAFRYASAALLQNNNFQGKSRIAPRSGGHGQSRK